MLSKVDVRIFKVWNRLLFKTNLEAFVVKNLLDAGIWGRLKLNQNLENNLPTSCDDLTTNWRLLPASNLRWREQINVELTSLKRFNFKTKSYCTMERICSLIKATERLPQTLMHLTKYYNSIVPPKLRYVIEFHFMRQKIIKLFLRRCLKILGIILLTLKKYLQFSQMFYVFLFGRLERIKSTPTKPTCFSSRAAPIQRNAERTFLEPFYTLSYTILWLTKKYFYFTKH